MPPTHSQPWKPTPNKYTQNFKGVGYIVERGVILVDDMEKLTPLKPSIPFLNPP
jgi:hypothetical protein